MTIKTRKLGDTGLELGELAVGTWGLCAGAYGRVFPEQCAATLTRAVDQGITVFDMAPSWGPDGEAERAVASAVGDKRDQVTYITRAGRVRGEHGLEPRFSPEQLREQCEASLQRLSTDRIDVLLLQHPSAELHLRDDALRATLEALQLEGKIRTWGASVSHADDARAALVSGAKVLCVPFSMLEPDIVWDIQSECRGRGVGLIARSVLMHGLLAGRWGEKKRFTTDDHRSERWNFDALAVRVRQANDFKQRAAPNSTNMTSVALHFALAHDDVSCAVFGPRTPAQVVSATEALSSELALNPVDLQFIYNGLR